MFRQTITVSWVRGNILQRVGPSQRKLNVIGNVHTGAECLSNEPSKAKKGKRANLAGL